MLSFQYWHGTSGPDTFVFDANKKRNALEGYGGPDNDSITGGDKIDYISGDAGNDLLKGLRGADELLGGQGHDKILGGKGSDHLDGGGQGDTIKGQEDDDYIFGWTGNDRLVGGQGDDYLDGEKGNDTLVFGQGNDYLLGGDGFDHMVYKEFMGKSKTYIEDFTTVDQIRFSEESGVTAKNCKLDGDVLWFDGDGDGKMESSIDGVGYQLGDINEARFTGVLVFEADPYIM